MRTLVDLGDERLRALDELSKGAKKSRSALIRDAVDDYLAKHPAKMEHEAFGLWVHGKAGGVAYQRKVRREW